MPMFACFVCFVCLFVCLFVDMFVLKLFTSPLEDDCLTYNCEGGSRPMSRSSGGGSRPMSVVSSRDGRETPLRYTPSSEEGRSETVAAYSLVFLPLHVASPLLPISLPSPCSQSSVLSEHMETVSAMDIDAVVKHLR